MKRHQRLAFVLILAFATSATAQKQAAKPAPPIPIDPAIEVMPRGSWGEAAVGALYDALLPLTKLEKDQYETTDQFNARLAVASPRLAASVGDRYAFAFSDDSYTYNADLQQYQPGKYAIVCLWTRPSHPTQKPCFFNVIRIRESKYAGVTAMGVTSTVTRREGIQIELAISNAQELSQRLAGPDGFTGPPFPYPLEKARTFRAQKIHMVLIASLVDLQMESKLGVSASATINLPVEVRHDAYVLRVKAEELWFVATPGGQVLHKIPVN